MKIIFPTLNWNICKERTATNTVNSVRKKQCIFFYNHGSLPQNCKRYRESHALFSETFKRKLELLRSTAGRDWKVPRGWRNQDRLSCWQPGKWGERRFAGTRLYRNCQVERKREKVNSWELNWKALQECERQNKENTQKIKTVRTLFQSIHLELSHLSISCQPHTTRPLLIPGSASLKIQRISPKVTAKANEHN